MGQQDSEAICNRLPIITYRCIICHLFIICLSACVLVAQLCLTLCNPWTIACQGPLSMGFPWQEYWSGLPFPPPWDLPDPGIKPVSPVSPALHRFFTR